MGLVTIETQSLEMELEADMSFISKETYLQLFKHMPLQKLRTCLNLYSDVFDRTGFMTT